MQMSTSEDDAEDEMDVQEKEGTEEAKDDAIDVEPEVCEVLHCVI